MKFFRDMGAIVCRVEQRLHMPGSPFPITRDAFNFGDVLAAGFFGVALVQSTTTAHMPERIQKIRKIPETRKWLEAGGKIYVHGWAKRGPRGKRKLWTLTESEITL